MFVKQAKNIILAVGSNLGDRQHNIEKSKYLINSNEKIKINPSMIQPVKEIKTLGTFKVILNLHSEIQTEINIKVISEDNK